MKFTTAFPIFILLAHDALAMPWLDTGIQPRSDGCLTACWHGEKLKAIPCIVKCFFGSNKKGAADQSTGQQDTTQGGADQGSDDDESSSDEEIVQHGDIVQCFWDCMATFEQMGLYWGDATGDKIRTNCVNACRR